MRYILFIFTFVSITGCSLLRPYKIDIPQGNMVTQEMLATVEIGMTKEQVKFIIGTPVASTPLSINTWLYYYQETQNGEIVKTQSIQLQFEDDYLAKISGNAIITDADLK